MEYDLSYHYKIGQKTKHFLFAPENRIIDPDDFTPYMKKLKPKKYTRTKKPIFDWTHKKKFLVPPWMRKLFVRHGMVIDKVHEIISFKQSDWLEKNISFDTQKRKKQV